eukprot:PhM_4_TR3572/c0_g2_i1/m.75465
MEKALQAKARCDDLEDMCDHLEEERDALAAECVRLRQNSGKLWGALGIAMSPAGTMPLSVGDALTVVSSPITFLQMSVEEANLDWAWLCLGKALGANATVDIYGVGVVGSADCYIRAAEINPYCAGAWYHLTRYFDGRPASDTILVDGKPYTRMDCLIQAVVADPGDSDVWCALGDHIAECGGIGEMVDVKGVAMSALECYIQAVSNASGKAPGKPWKALAAALRQCPKGHAVHVNGEAYTRRRCLQKILEVDRTATVDVWYELGVDLSPGEVVSILGLDYGRLDLFSSAAAIAPSFALAWRELALGNTQGVPVIVRERQFTRVECAMKALELDETMREMWLLLGELLRDGDARITIRGVPVSASDCRAKYLAMFPRGRITAPVDPTVPPAPRTPPAPPSTPLASNRFTLAGGPHARGMVLSPTPTDLHSKWQ